MKYNKLVISLITLFSSPSALFAQGLSFGEEDAAAVVDVSSQFPYSTVALIAFAIYFVAFLGAVFFFLKKSKQVWSPSLRLGQWPVSGKAIVSLALFSYGLVHVLSVLEVYLKTNISFASTSEYFFYMKLAKLVATSHAHFFGHATMYALTSVVFLFTTLSERWKIIFISTAMGAGILDVPSWWMIKYAGSQYEVFSMLAGMMSAVGFSFMAIRIFTELWFSKKTNTI